MRILLAIAGLAAVAVGAAVPAWAGRARLERAAAEVDRVIERARDAALAGAVTTVRLESRRVGSPELESLGRGAGLEGLGSARRLAATHGLAGRRRRLELPARAR